MSPEDERSYIQAVLAGNTQAYAYLVNAHKRMVFNLCIKVVRNHEDAKEVAQDTFLKAFERLQTFQGQSRFATWLYKIAYHTALNKIKRKKIFMRSIHATSQQEDEPVIQLVDTHFEDQFSQLKHEQQKLYLQKALDQLSQEDAIIMTLFYLAQHSMEEISEVTGMDVNNIKTKLHRGRKKLYQKLSGLLKEEVKELI